MSSVSFLDLPAVQPIRRLLADPQITEIMINGPGQVFVERGGRFELFPLTFEDPGALRRMIDTFVEPTGRSVNTSRPFVDFRLPDGSRVNVIIPPLCLNGATVTIRKFTRSLTTISELVRLGTLSKRMAYLLCGAVEARLNILFSGATGSGKTTLLGILSRRIPESERIITVEDTAELDLQQAHVVRLECRPPNIEGEGAVKMSDLLRNCLRMRPTRIIVGEIRGEEAVDMLQAITSGHQGCLAVLHASSPLDAVSRLEMMVLSRGLHLPLWAIHKQIASAVDLIVQMEMLTDGARKVTHITEVRGVEADQITLEDLYTFELEGRDESGRVNGKFVCSGVEPLFLNKFQRMGVEAPAELFAAGAG